MEELRQISQRMFLIFADAADEYWDIDLIKFSKSPIPKIIIFLYVAAFIFLIVQIVRRKYSLEYDLTELGNATFHFLWGLGVPLVIRQWKKEGTFTNSPVWVAILMGIVMPIILIVIWSDPLSILFHHISQYGWLGIIYFWALLGVGVFGMLCVLVWFLFAILPVIAVMVALAAVASGGESSMSLWGEDDEDYF